MPPRSLSVVSDVSSSQRPVGGRWAGAARVRRRFERILAPAGQSALPTGIPLAAVIFAALSSLALSGPIRAVTRMPIGGALATAVLGCAGVGWLLWPLWRARARTSEGRLERIAVDLLALVPVVWAVRSLYIAAFDGLPNLDGWDAGTHVYLQTRFADSSPGEYHGFVSHLSLSFWLSKLPGSSVFLGVRNAFYLVVAGYCLVPVAIGFALVRSRHTRHWPSRLAGVATTALVACWALQQVALPLFHYNQAMGFYAHLFSLLPLGLLWATDALVRSEPLRIAGVGVALVWLRYSYGLNLPDALLASAALLVLGAPRASNLVVQVAIAAALAAAAYFGYELLGPVLQIRGGLRQLDRESALATNVAVVVGVAVILALAQRWPIDDEGFAAQAFRSVRFPLLFAAVSTIAFIHYRTATPTKHYYYLTKYQMSATLLLAPALAVVAGLLVAELARGRVVWRSPPCWITSAAFAALLWYAPQRWNLALASYLPAFTEREAVSVPPFQHLHPVADAEGMRRIQAVLRDEGKRFGGYLTTWMPAFNFTNAAFGHHTGAQQFFPPRTDAGHCVFWVPPGQDLLRTKKAEEIDRDRKAVAVGPDVRCGTYAVPWKATPHGLCHRCY